MNTKIKPFISWSIWAGGLSLVTGFVTRRWILAGFRSDETGMSLVITALFGIGMVLSFRAARQLHKEWAVLSLVKQTGRLPGSKHTTDLASVFGSLQDYKDRGMAVDVHAAIGTYQSRHTSRVRSVSLLAALVISMGLLGTVVGLIMSISGLGGMVENIGLSRAVMLDALKQTVAGMGTAFYTTFFGAVAGMVLRAVAGAQLNSLSELCAAAAEYADTHLAARLDDKEEQVNQQVSKVVASFENMQRRLDELTVRIVASVDASMARFGESIEQAGRHALDATTERIDGMAAQMGAFGQEMGTAFGSLNDSIRQAGEEVGTAIGAVNGSIERSGEELHAAFGGLNEVVGQAGRGVAESFDGLNGTIAAAGQGVENVFGELGGTVKLASDTVAGSLAEFKLAVDGTSEELNEAVGELHASISQATGEMVSMAKARLDSEASEIAGHLSVAAGSIQHYLQQRQAKESNQKVA